MSNRDDVENQKARYPEEADEPLHTCLFCGECFRVYCAVIPPGVETGYHRHSEDALAVVVDGGNLSSTTLYPRRLGRYMFPGYAGWLKKLWVGVRGLITGSVCFKTGAFFATMNKGYPMVHKVSASVQNAVALKLLSIQLFPPEQPAQTTLYMIPEGAKKRLVTDKYVVYTMRVNPGAGAKRFQSDTPALVVALGCGLLLTGALSRVDWSVELCRGQFHSLESGERIDITCVTHRPSYALFVMLR